MEQNLQSLVAIKHPGPKVLSAADITECAAIISELLGVIAWSYNLGKISGSAHSSSFLLVLLHQN